METKKMATDTKKEKSRQWDGRSRPSTDLMVKLVVPDMIKELDEMIVFLAIDML